MMRDGGDVPATDHSGATAQCRSSISWTCRSGQLPQNLETALCQMMSDMSHKFLRSCMWPGGMGPKRQPGVDSSCLCCPCKPPELQPACPRFLLQSNLAVFIMLEWRRPAAPPYLFSVQRDAVPVEVDGMEWCYGFSNSKLLGAMGASVTNVVSKQAWVERFHTCKSCKVHSGSGLPRAHVAQFASLPADGRHGHNAKHSCWCCGDLDFTDRGQAGVCSKYRGKNCSGFWVRGMSSFSLGLEKRWSSEGDAGRQNLLASSCKFILNGVFFFSFLKCCSFWSILISTCLSIWVFIWFGSSHLGTLPVSPSCHRLYQSQTTHLVRSIRETTTIYFEEIAATLLMSSPGEVLIPFSARSRNHLCKQ